MSTECEILTPDFTSEPAIQERRKKDRAKPKPYKPRMAQTIRWAMEDTVTMAIRATAKLRRALTWLEKEHARLLEEEKMATRFGPEVRAQLVEPRRARLAELAIIIADVALEISEIERKQSGLLRLSKTTSASDEQNGGASDEDSPQQTRGGPS